jgi:hypothetical protein
MRASWSRTMLSLKASCCLVGSMLPLTAAAQAKVRAARLGTGWRGFQQLDEAAVGETTPVHLDGGLDPFSGQGVRDEDHAPTGVAAQGIAPVGDGGQLQGDSFHETQSG